MQKSYKIETERLLIRCYEPADAINLKDAIDSSLDHLRRWLPWAKKEPENIEEKAKRVRQFRGQFDLGIDYVMVIYLKNENILIGSTGLHTRIEGNAREIGYWIRSSYANKGFVTESTKALVKVGFEIEDLDRIEIHCSVKNKISAKIPEQLGFIHQTTTENSCQTGTSLDDRMIWTITKELYSHTDITQEKIKVYDFLNNRIL